ncbi:MAG: IS1182 family transposase, partial [Chloroflexota bacterium]
MLGKRSKQKGLFEADNLYLDLVGGQSFYGFLASQRGQFFRDEEFADLYCANNGRNSVPPSLLATVLLLQAYDRVSDEEAKEKADFDLRWKVALGIDIKDRPFAKSTLQLFRAQLILHDRVRAVFVKSLSFARQTGYLKKHKIKAVVDTTYILGRGAVKDTYNLLADGIIKLVGALASLAGEKAEDWAAARGLSRYFGSSLKGEVAVDWDDKAARRKFLQGVVADADRLLEGARQVRERCPEGSAEDQRVVEAAQLLGQLLLQDVERRADGAELKQGVSPDRIPSVHDPEMRHGRKSKAKRFDGHKTGVAVEPESQLITAATVLAGNAPDNSEALQLVEETEENTGLTVEETIGDCAFGDGGTRQEFAEADRKLVAKVPGRPNLDHFPKEDFAIDLELGACTCPGGQDTRRLMPATQRGEGPWQRYFEFDGAVCNICSLRPRCVAAAEGKGRRVSLHPQEALLQEARAFQRSEAFEPYRKMRQAAEHRLARLVALGIRQARYFGRAKTLFQVLLAATVANLT